MYGGIGCLGTPLVRSDAAAIWATGNSWFQVPPVAKVELTGKLGESVTGKDVIVALCALFNNDEVLNMGLEFTGEGVSQLSIDDRLSIANMTTEWGALIGLFPVDEKCIEWLESQRQRDMSPDRQQRLCKERITNIPELHPDPSAYYAKTLTLNLSSLSPHISGPNSVKIATPATVLEAQKIKVDKAYLVSCVNSRETDIASAATIIKGKRLAPHVKFYIAAASSVVQNNAETAGHWQILLDAGAIPLPPGCGPCVGLGTGLLEDGQVGISATNRNFKGRMGSPKALAYLASPGIIYISN